MKKIAMNEEMMNRVCGGYNLDDLSPEDFAELQRLAGLNMEMRIMKMNGDPAWTKEKALEVAYALDELNRKLHEKYD